MIYLSPERVKTKKGRAIALSDTALATMRELRARKGFDWLPYVFVNTRTKKRYTSIWRSWGRLREKAGCRQVRIHDLRHSFASYTRRLGMDRMDRKALMGHSTEEAHELYSAVDAEALRGVINRHSPSTLLAQHKLGRSLCNQERTLDAHSPHTRGSFLK